MSTTSQLYNEADRLKNDGKYEEAIVKLNELLQLDESYVLAHLALAVVYGKVNKHEDSIRHGQRACELEPDDPFNFTSLSVTCQRAYEGTQNPQLIQMAEDAMARARTIQGGHQH